MAHTHVHREVHDLSVQFEVVRDSFVDHIMPFLMRMLDLACVESNAIAPKVTDLPDLVNKFFVLCLSGHMM